MDCSYGNSWSRSKYDVKTSSIDDKISTAPYNYITESGVQTVNNCMNDLMKDRTIGFPSTKANMNSSLIGLNVENDNVNYSVLNIPKCKNNTEYSRLVNNPCTLRCTGYNNFAPLNENPQNNLSNPDSFNAGNNSRNLAREQYNKNNKIKCKKYINYSALPMSNHKLYEDDGSGNSKLTAFTENTLSYSYL